MAASYGINFRDTSGFVTDGANETYCLGDSYPTTRGGLTFGWLSPDDTFIDSRDRDSGVDRRFAGMNFVSNAGGNNPLRFQVDLPSIGTWYIRAAFGDFSFGQTIYAVFKDNATTFKTLSNLATSTNTFYDAQGNLVTSGVWPVDNVVLIRNFVSTTLIIEIGDPANVAADNTTISHINIVSAASRVIDIGNTLTDDLALLFLVDSDSVPTELVNNNVASINGTPTVGSGTGYVGTVDLMHLVGANSDYYSLPNDLGYQVTGPMTIAWLGTLSSGGAFRDFISKINLSVGPTGFGFNTSNANPPIASFSRYSVEGVSNIVESTATLSIGSPHAVLVTHDGNQVGNQRVWVDGTEGSSQFRAEGGTLGDSDTVPRIGRRQDGVVQMDGYDEMVVIWARVLSDAEIASFFADPYQLLVETAAAGSIDSIFFGSAL